MKRIICFLLMSIAWLSCAGVAAAFSLTVDQYLYAPDPNFDTSTLSAGVEITREAGDPENSFRLYLYNNTPTSTEPYDFPSIVTLTGVEIELPTGWNIIGGFAPMMDQNDSDYTPSQLWGYNNESGAGPFANLATLPTNAVVSTLESAITDPFASPSWIDGPSGGVAPSGYFDFYPASWPAYKGVADYFIIYLDHIVKDVSDIFDNVTLLLISKNAMSWSPSHPQPVFLSLLQCCFLVLALWR